MISDELQAFPIIGQGSWLHPLELPTPTYLGECLWTEPDTFHRGAALRPAVGLPAVITFALRLSCSWSSTIQSLFVLARKRRADYPAEVPVR